MKETVLLIEDEKLMRVTLEDALRTAGYEVTSFETGTEALRSLKSPDRVGADVVVTDVRLPDIDGLNILEEITQMNDAQVIVMTAFGTIKDAVNAMRLGAFDYITKPFSLDEFLLLIERALEVKKLRNENIRLKKDLGRCYGFPNIIGEGSEMKKIFSLIERVSGSDSTILILGESGTGKELIATTIHYQSKRKDKPLIKVNCAAMPEGLIESELFGHEKGAFTGAIRRKPGRFELAECHICLCEKPRLIVFVINKPSLRFADDIFWKPIFSGLFPHHFQRLIPEKRGIEYLAGNPLNVKALKYIFYYFRLPGPCLAPVNRPVQGFDPCLSINDACAHVRI